MVYQYLLGVKQLLDPLNYRVPSNRLLVPNFCISVCVMQFETLKLYHHYNCDHNIVSEFNARPKSVVL